MENLEATAAVTALGDELLQAEVDAEFEAMAERWAEQQRAKRGEYSEERECLDRLLETRAVLAALQAEEQQLLARMERIALEGAGSSPREGDPGAERATDRDREIAWRSTVATIAVATRQADRTVQARLSAASTLVHDFPQTFEALASGRISWGHSRVIVENGSGITDAEARAEYEGLTVARAEETTPGKLARTARIAAARLRPGTFEERHAAAREERGIAIRDLDNGMSELSHLLPTPFAAAIHDRLTRQAKAVAAAGDPRTRDQLRSDLAVDLLLTGEPACGEHAPHSAAEGIRAELSIVIPALTLLGHDDEPATLAGRGPFDLDTACRLASQAPSFWRLLTDPVTGAVLELDNYRPSAALRRYLEARDGHCRFPSCNRDAKYCDADHTEAWSEGGTTTPGNLALLCRWHHILKHHSGWKVKQTTPGVLEWTNPVGEVVTERPDRMPRFRADGCPESAAESGPPF